jgi:hypothetical protein
MRRRVTKRACTKIQAITGEPESDYSFIAYSSTTMHNYLCIMPAIEGSNYGSTKLTDIQHNCGERKHIDVKRLVEGELAISDGLRQGCGNQRRGGRKGVLAEVKLLDLPQQGIPVNP